MSHHVTQWSAGRSIDAWIDYGWICEWMYGEMGGSMDQSLVLWIDG